VLRSCGTRQRTRQLSVQLDLAVEDLFPRDLNAFAPALLDQSQSLGRERRNVSLAVNLDFAAQRSLERRHHNREIEQSSDHERCGGQRPVRRSPARYGRNFCRTLVARGETPAATM